MPNVMPVRDDLAYFVVHPHHPYLFNTEVDERTGNRICSEVLSPRIVPALFTRRLRKRRGVLCRGREDQPDYFCSGGKDIPYHG